MNFARFPLVPVCILVVTGLVASQVVGKPEPNDSGDQFASDPQLSVHSASEMKLVGSDDSYMTPAKEAVALTSESDKLMLLGDGVACDVIMEDGELLVGGLRFDAIDLRSLSLSQSMELDDRIRGLQVEIKRNIVLREYPEDMVLYENEFFAAGLHLDVDQIYSVVKVKEDREVRRCPNKFAYLRIPKEASRDAYATRDARERLLFDSPLRAIREEAINVIASNPPTESAQFFVSNNLQYAYWIGSGGVPIGGNSIHLLFP